MRLKFIVGCILMPFCLWSCRKAEMKVSDNNNIIRSIYTSPTSGDTFTLLGQGSCEIKDGHDIILGSYTQEEETLRIVCKKVGAEFVTYYTVIEGGYINSNKNNTFLNEAALSQYAKEKQKKEEDQAAHEIVLEKRKIESTTSTKVIDSYKVSNAKFFGDEVYEEITHSIMAIISDADVTIQISPDPENLSRKLKYRSLENLAENDQDWGTPDERHCVDVSSLTDEFQSTFKGRGGDGAFQLTFPSEEFRNQFTDSVLDARKKWLNKNTDQRYTKIEPCTDRINKNISTDIVGTWKMENANSLKFNQDFTGIVINANEVPGNKFTWTVEGNFLIISDGKNINKGRVVTLHGVGNGYSARRLSYVDVYSGKIVHRDFVY